MCQYALALLAAGAQDAPLLFPAVLQLPDSRFPQKLFINGAPWLNDEKQLDEDSFPSFSRTTCARRVYCSSSTRGMVLAAAGVLIANGPMTVQERWDDQEGYSPSTLASKYRLPTRLAKLKSGISPAPYRQSCCPRSS
jgi:glucoamylase